MKLFFERGRIIRHNEVAIVKLGLEWNRCVLVDRVVTEFAFVAFGWSVGVRSRRFVN